MGEEETEKKTRQEKSVSNLVFYAQSTITVISRQETKNKTNMKQSKMRVTSRK